MNSAFTSSSKDAVSLHLVAKADFDVWLKTLPDVQKAFVETMEFKGVASKSIYLPDEKGNLTDVAFGLGDVSDPMMMAGAAASLKEGAYKIEFQSEALKDDHLYAGWIDGAYQFNKYKKASKNPPVLVVSNKATLAQIQIDEAAAKLARDLINTPAEDMGPTQIAETIEVIAKEHNATVSQVLGDALLEENYPMVHAVGRAAKDAPRYVELSWGKKAKGKPHIALVGKGVSFDTGGLNVKTGNYMRIMKKDMGGAAHAIALAQMIMASKLDVYLTLHIPTVENAIGSGAFRPGDVLQSRKGLTVEIDNTDAEGRLILADALTRASELDPDYLIDFATLTGAARVALGTDVAPYFTDDVEFAGELEKASVEQADPLWRLPLWKPYLSMLNSSIADIVNGASSPFAGTITAALFLQKFVDAKSWTHLDVWGWRQGRYGRPEGGAIFGLRAIISKFRQNVN